MLEVKHFEEKLEQLQIATNAEGRDWLRGLMIDVENGQWLTTMVVRDMSFRLATWSSL